MSENYEIVKGFQTEQGQALYDYDSLHGKPDINALISESEERMRKYTDNEISEFKIPIDTSLSKAGEAADALAVGKAIEDSKVQIDKDFINEGQAADAKAVGVALKAIEDSKIQIDTSFTEEGQAADAKLTGDKIQETINYINDQLEQIELDGVPYYDSEEVEVEAIVGDFVYATHLGGALAEEFAKKADILNQVDSKIGNLTASDVRAAPASHVTDKNNPHSVTAAQVGAASMEYAKKVSNPHNFLDNSDFSNPVAQLGLNGSNTYLCDRWRTYKVIAEQKDGYCTLTKTENVNSAYIGQLVSGLAGKTLTFAVKGESAAKVFLNFRDKSGVTIASKSMTSLSGILCLTATVPDDKDTVDFRFYPYYNTDGGSGDIYWAAVYEGAYTADTLPEYHPKGYANELLVCKQYDPNNGNYIGLTPAFVDAAPISHIGDKNNPHGVTREQVGALGFVGNLTSYDSDFNNCVAEGYYQINTNGCKNAPADGFGTLFVMHNSYITQVAFYRGEVWARSETSVERLTTVATWTRIDSTASAPAGYGYGEACPLIYIPEDSDGTKTTIKIEEHFAALSNNYSKRISVCNYSGIGSGYVFEGNLYRMDENEGTLQLYGADGLIIKRYKVNGEWKPWEYVNPPMEPDKEYRTTERWDGKPVYTKIVNCGALAHNHTDDVFHDTPNIEVVWVSGGSWFDGSTRFSIPYIGGQDDNHVFVSAQGNVIHRVHKGSVYNISEMTVAIKYTKSTD